MTNPQPRRLVSDQEFEQTVREQAYHLWKARELKLASQRFDVDDWLSAEKFQQVVYRRAPTHDEIAAYAAHLAERRRQQYAEQDWVQARHIVENWMRSADESA